MIGDIARAETTAFSEHLFATRLTSGAILDPGTLGLDAVDDPPFLKRSNALDAAVTSGLDIARRLGWDTENGLWHLGDLRRAYFVRRATARQ